ncbi:phosphoenolpyruvate carboxylase [Adhaeribacter radiodurans]|uniref:Phosphoenolpyruvate carboxylase n=1 Tax=Adhaeribacter radiodurans TaxID=2745197 RepID=A0A7L7L6N8_9BACT|nr:phosphoenolpyruvate carboxylase [Adhaeribacter radiodurans]QMU28443.1 phosphoenolpyruvate carboxylase [Adhaeribacter radiodurans]
MSAYSNGSLHQFRNLVGFKYEMYNSLFSSLPFYRVEKTGVLLSLFLLHCEEGLKKESSPNEIIESFFQQYTSYATEQEQTDLLFRFVQFAERQVVLFDALEDAAFNQINDMQGVGTLKHLESEIVQYRTQNKLAEKLQDFSVRLVLTAHPTQFYPSEVLGIINDLSKALTNDNTALANSYLQQLGKTPFFKKEKPTPYDEAVNLIWFLENVFYPATGQILSYLKNRFPNAINPNNPLIRMGFWPGGDRDGNPFVTVPNTLKVAEALRGGIVKSYYLEVRRLKKRLTFKGVANLLADLEQRLYNNLFVPGYKADLSVAEIKGTMQQIRATILRLHNGLFVNQVDSFLNKVDLFGLHFASLDIRQDSSVHTRLLEEVAGKSDVLPENYAELSEDDKINALLAIEKTIEPAFFEDELLQDTLESLNAIKTIQAFNGEAGCHRYIISHSTSALNVLEVYALFILRGWEPESISVDIVPLFETIEDLRNSGSVMQKLYENQTYRQHLQSRGNVQTIMLGFSDGTKDGGYLMANWSIYKAKEMLSNLSKQYEIEVVFFDGRGGPPARGGGKTHQFYASMGRNIANKEIQLTIQGQTISSNFGTVDAARYNMEQLMHAGISNALFSNREKTLTEPEEELLISLANESFNAYNTLKNHPDFLEYLNYVSPLRYYAEANIGSRPAKRKSGQLNLDDLRAVPYVGAWSQLKQNVPGFYGVGTALEKMEAAGKWPELKALYEDSLFFKTLLDNCEMAMNKCCFPVTAYLAEHPKYGVLWKIMNEEFERSKKYLLLLSGSDELMADKPIDQLSIQLRQRIELPLITIQQYALTKIRAMEEQQLERDEKKIYEKLVMRCSFGIINAERNSA